VCHLAIKVEQQPKGRKSFHSSFTKSPFTHIEIETRPPQVKALDKDNEIASKLPKRLEERNF